MNRSPSSTTGCLDSSTSSASNLLRRGTLGPVSVTAGLEMNGRAHFAEAQDVCKLCATAASAKWLLFTRKNAQIRWVLILHSISSEYVEQHARVGGDHADNYLVGELPSCSRTHVRAAAVHVGRRQHC